MNSSFLNSFHKFSKTFLSSGHLQDLIGNEICLISNTDPIITSNNKILLGKLLVIFEELPTFSKAQWSGVSAKLKT